MGISRIFHSGESDISEVENDDTQPEYNNFELNFDEYSKSSSSDDDDNITEDANDNGNSNPTSSSGIVWSSEPPVKNNIFGVHRNMAVPPNESFQLFVTEGLKLSYKKLWSVPI